FFLLGNIFGISTAFQLLDLAQPTQPLLKELLLSAPGTYHHSIIVGNLAETAAQSIGANPLLARVGAYYHDIGKSKRPWFFGENQLDGVNIHDNLPPETSADIIISHVREGLTLARQHRLPGIIRDYIAQHHGTFLTLPFYRQALKDKSAQDVDAQDFRYPGPKPQTREAAILMLADTCEAAVRSIHPHSPQELAQLIDKLIQDRLVDGQLDQCELRLRDLAAIKEAFASTLQGMFHSRVAYPEAEPAPSAPDPGETKAAQDAQPRS
ncbi:MAG: HDIG domain-containing protein, partial [Chloroflexota bacterium]|nr:HDIG domain-containing protein [Chloroflexota bacterium]